MTPKTSTLDPGHETLYPKPGGESVLDESTITTIVKDLLDPGDDVLSKYP